MLVRCLLLGVLTALLVGGVWGQQPQKEREKAFRAISFTAVTIVKVDSDKNTLTVKGTYRGQPMERTLLVQPDSQFMKEGKPAKLEDFKEGEQVLVHWRSVRRGEYAVRYLADPPTFFAFFRYPTLRGKVKSFDPANLVLVVEAEGKEHKLTLPGRGECCFAGGKAYRGKAGVWKGGEEVIAVLRTPDQARVVFDPASWKIYGEREWQSYLKRAKTRQPTE